MRCPNCQQHGLRQIVERCRYCGAPALRQTRDELPQGTTLENGRYCIDRTLGRGGFGITYRAFDITLNFEVVIKEFFPLQQVTREPGTNRITVPAVRSDDYERALNQFLEEARILAKITEENVVRVYHYFKSHNTAYIVMGLVAGRTLRELLDQRPKRRFSASELEEIVGQLVVALDAIHSKGVLHLDISSDNVMRTDKGKVVLIDFGAARQFLRAKESQGNEGNLQRKPAYAPPEIADKEVGPRSDLFELAMMAHELLTGDLPPSVAQRLATKDMWRPQVTDKKWQKALARGLHLKPERRPNNVREWWAMYNQEGIIFGARKDKMMLGPSSVRRTEPNRRRQY